MVDGTSASLYHHCRNDSIKGPEERQESITFFALGKVEASVKETHLDLMGSPGLWKGLHMTSVKELCNFLNIWEKKKNKRLNYKNLDASLNSNELE